jgi:glycine amidinotransferase
MNRTGSPTSHTQGVLPVVNSHNEWDPLQEVVIGIPDGAVVPPWNAMLGATMPDQHRKFFQENGGRPFPKVVVDDARREIDGLARFLEREGVVVRFPDVVEHARGFATPDWQSECGLYAAMPRDVLLVVGNEIIEAPMAWRSRYFEVNAYRTLLKDYSRRGARWTAAPKPTLQDPQYDGHTGKSGYLVTEFEPTFDAADFIRCGKDLFVQRSHVTNMFGIQWLRQHLGPTYRVHVIDVCDPHPMHIDATLMPLAAGKLLANPERLPVAPAQFRNWEIRYAPPPTCNRQKPLYMSSNWVSMNVLSLDEHRVLVEQNETELASMLKAWGFEPIPCPFQGFNALGGSFHCAALDIRRGGQLQSYF